MYSQFEGAFLFRKTKKLVANHNIFDIRCAIISIERKRKGYRKCKQLNYVILVKVQAHEHSLGKLDLVIYRIMEEIIEKNKENTML